MTEYNPDNAELVWVQVLAQQSPVRIHAGYAHLNLFDPPFCLPIAR